MGVRSVWRFRRDVIATSLHYMHVSTRTCPKVTRFGATPTSATCATSPEEESILNYFKVL